MCCNNRWRISLQRKLTVLKVGKIEDKQQVKDHLLENFLFYMVKTQNKLAKIFINVTYTYDVYAQVLNEMIAYKNYNKLRGNK